MSLSVQVPVFEEPVYTQQQLAHLLCTRRDTLWRWRREKTGPRYYKIGKRLYYRQSDVNAWLESHKGGV